MATDGENDFIFSGEESSSNSSFDASRNPFNLRNSDDTSASSGPSELVAILQNIRHPSPLEPGADANDDVLKNPLLSYPSSKRITGGPMLAPPRIVLSRSDLKSRYLVLLLACVYFAGTYYSYDIPASLHKQLSERMGGRDNFETYFSLLYTVYSIPNVILPLFGGLFVDRIGTTRCILVFTVSNLIGQCVFVCGVQLRSWSVMIAGRFIYGLGAESIVVASSTLLANWYGDKEVALAFGVSLALGRMGSVLVDIASPIFAGRGSTVMAAAVGILANLTTVVCALFLFPVEKQAEIRCRRNAEAVQNLTASLLSDGDAYNLMEGEEYIMDDEEDDEEEGEQAVRLSDIRYFGALFWLLSASCLIVYGAVLPFNNIASGLLLERNYFMDPDPGCTLMYPTQCTGGTLASSNPSMNSSGSICTNLHVAPVLPSSLNYTFREEGWLQPSYVLETLHHTDVNCDDPFFSQACTADFCSAQKHATVEAGRTMSIPFAVSAGLSPVFGFLVDRIELRALLTVIAPTMLLIVHTTLAFAGRGSSPIFPLVGQGVAYALFAAVIWPSIPLSVGPGSIGTAFGTVTSIQNCGLAIFPIIIAAIYESSGQRFIPHVEMLFIILTIVGIFIGIVLNIVDASTGSKLNGFQSSTDVSEDGILEEEEVQDII